jgi:hypothetical protein
MIRVNDENAKMIPRQIIRPMENSRKTRSLAKGPGEKEPEASRARSQRGAFLPLLNGSIFKSQVRRASPFSLPGALDFCRNNQCIRPLSSLR